MALLAPQFAWLEITGFCNLACRHCYAGSSPQGDHGTMTAADWRRVIDELGSLGVRDVQFIGGEPTLHPDLPQFIRHARSRHMRVEVFSNLTHVTDPVWEALRLPDVRLAFSYYSDDAKDHDDVTETRGSHARTRANVEKAKALGIPMRGSVINVLQGQRGGEGRRQLLDIGLRDVRTDKVRPFGRGADGAAPDVSKLCGRCGRNKLAVSPNGDVWPCVFARWMTVGNVHEQSLRDIYHGVAMQGARAELAAAHPEKAPRAGGDPSCLPDCNPSFDTCSPQLACAPDAECNPTQGGDDRLREPIMSPHRTVRYSNPRVAGTDC
ncbi:radical SAM/SPASM domain-containing protein [Streptomyces sp. NRRL S-337]|uniref:radical SAM/SPASM domain-containing protein n=1 Tax=Streptomyces sp. NRRL S-337 TaxID=1463900 RepID=UPI00056B3321|nr:radical SAM protein [Streptomyces sp. NRRL S-337]